MIYFILNRDNGQIKIGYTGGHPIQRQKQISATVSGNLELLRFMEGDRRTERKLHNRFSSLRDHGEWFISAPDLTAYIDALPQLTLPPLTVSYTATTILKKDKDLLLAILEATNPRSTIQNLLGWIIRQEHARRFPAAAVGGAAGGAATEGTTQP